MVLSGAVVRRWRGPTRSPAELRRKYAARTPPLPAPATRSVRRVADVDETRIDGRPVFTATPRSSATGWNIIYTHGGGLVNPLLRAHWNIVAELVRTTGASVTVPIYPLAPEHQHAEAFAFLERVYCSLLERIPSSRLLLCGDSAGGNLALSQTLRYRARGMPVPARVVLFSPWLDLTMSNPEAAAVERRDVMLRCSELAEWGLWWSGASDPGDPALSPLFADLRALPPILLFQGTHDLLWPDTRALRRKVREAGGRIDLHEARGAFHVYVAATFTPEAKRVFRAIAEDVCDAEPA